MAREINSTEVIIQPIVPKAVDDQQVIVYIPTASTGSYGAIKLETDNLNPDVIAPNGIIQLRNGRVLQTKVDVVEVPECVYATPNTFIPYTEFASENTIVYRNEDGNFNSGDAKLDSNVVNLRVLKQEIGKALVDYDSLNIQNGKGTGSLVQKTANNINDAPGLYSSAFGYGIKASNTNGFAVGRFNEDLKNSIFEVGIGHDLDGVNPLVRRTGFAVYEDGRAMVYAEPKEDNDVVRKKEHDTKLDKVTTSSTYSRLYAVSSTGEQFLRNVSVAAEGITIPIRDEQGRMTATDGDGITNVATVGQLNKKYDKTGGTISGNVVITGDLTVNGTQHINQTDNLNVKNAMIYSNSDAVDLTTLAGLGIKTNSTNVYGIVYDLTSDSVKLGLGKSNATGVFTFNEGEGWAIAVRDESAKLVNDNFVKWDSTNRKLVDAGKNVDSLLQKPTTVLTKESFVKVGIDGTQIFDESSYIISPSVNGKVGQVLKKTTTGTQWSDESGDGSIAVTISAPTAATQGVLTEEQLSTLQANDNNYIVFNNELYRLADKQHTTGILSYTHTGWNGTAMLDKSINITISTRAWTLVVGEGSGGTNVVANPGTGTTRITDIQIGNTKYFILPEKYEQYLRDNTFVEPTVTLAVTIQTQPVKDNKYLYGQTVVASISHKEVKNDAASLNNLTLYWKGSSIQSNITPSIGTLATIVSSGSYTLSISNNRFELRLPYTDSDGFVRNVSSYKTIDAGYALYYGAGDMAGRFDTTNMKNIISSGTVNISVTTTANQRITIAFPGTVTAKTNSAFSTEVPLTLIETVNVPIYDNSTGDTVLATASYNIYQTEQLKAGTNDIILTLGGN